MSKTCTAFCDVTQMPEFRELMRKQRECRMKKSGLFGAYSTAKSEVGEQVYDITQQPGAKNGAYLWGSPGTGKTYAAACAVRMAIEAGKKAKLTTAKRLLDDIKDGFETGDAFPLESAEDVYLLALDDLGAERPTEWAMETLTRLIDTRVSRGLPTVITSNFRLGELRDEWGGIQGSRIVSRLAGSCEVINVSGDDRRLGEGGRNDDR